VDMEAQDGLDVGDAALETPQEMHERMLVEDAGEETIDLLEGLRELQGGELVTWKVWRVAGPNGEPLRLGPSEYLAELGNSQLTMQNLASLFGGGKYRVKGRYASGKIAGGRTITIGADAKRSEEYMAPAASSGGTPPFNMSEFLALQQHQDQVREERFEKRMMTLASIFAPVITAFVSRPAGAAPDLAALITALRPVTAPPDPSAQMKGMVETMLLMRKLNGDGDGDSLASIVTAIAPHAGPVLTALASRQQAAPVRQRVVAPGSQPTRIPPAAGAGAAVPIQQAPPLAVRQMPPVAQVTPHTGVNLDAPSQPLTQDDRAMFAQLKPQVDSLVQMAREGSDPLMTAQVFFDNVMMSVDDQIYDRLCVLIENPQAIEQLTIFNTGVKEQRPFFEAFQNKVKELIAGQDQAAQNSAVAG
jgi:hypothetical protein